MCVCVCVCVRARTLCVCVCACVYVCMQSLGTIDKSPVGVYIQFRASSLHLYHAGHQEAQISWYIIQGVDDCTGGELAV